MSRIAIIGTGIAGLGAAHFLHPHHDLTLFEKNDYPGGHTNTITVEEAGRPVPIDTGFMVFNHATYPNLVRLFQELDVATQKTEMSFSVQHVPTNTTVGALASCSANGGICSVPGIGNCSWPSTASIPKRWPP